MVIHLFLVLLSVLLVVVVDLVLGKAGHGVLRATHAVAVVQLVPCLVLAVTAVTQVHTTSAATTQAAVAAVLPVTTAVMVVVTTPLT